MTTKGEEKAAFEKLKEVDVGEGHESRVLNMSMKNYDEDLEYGAYISGYGSGNYNFYGWSHASTPMKAVEDCITRAKEVNRQIEEAENKLINH